MIQIRYEKKISSPVEINKSKMLEKRRKKITYCLLLLLGLFFIEIYKLFKFVVINKSKMFGFDFF